MKKRDLESQPIQLKYSEVPWLRDKLLKEQGGVCAICGKVPVRAVLDHDHGKRIKGSSLCRGTICLGCNSLLGKAENAAVRCGVSQQDLPSVLRGMAAYKERAHTRYIHPTEKPKAPKLSKRCYTELAKCVTKKDKLPAFPKNGKLTKPLEKLFKQHNVQIVFLKEK